MFIILFVRGDTGVASNECVMLDVHVSVHVSLVFKGCRGNYSFSIKNLVSKIPKKQSVGVYIFDNMALYFECRINKSALLQTAFFGYFIIYHNHTDSKKNPMTHST